MRSAFEHHTWRWEARRELILRALDHLERELVRTEHENAEGAGDAPSDSDLRARIAEQRQCLIALGPCPRPLMG
ncbi:MAG TPA: hypothetical protein VIC85_10455 [Ktedonobacterales bacterium]